MTVAAVWKSTISRHNALSLTFLVALDRATGVSNTSSLEDGEGGRRESCESRSGMGGKCDSIGSSDIVLINPRALSCAFSLRNTCKAAWSRSTLLKPGQHITDNSRQDQNEPWNGIVRDRNQTPSPPTTWVLGWLWLSQEGRRTLASLNNASESSTHQLRASSLTSAVPSFPFQA